MDNEISPVSTEVWKPDMDTAPLDERMDNAMRRVSGSIGFDLAFDKGRMRAMKDTAADALGAGLSTPGPLFMRVGQGVLSLGVCKIGESVSLKDIGAEILSEFHTEAVAAFQAAKATLYADALAFMQSRGMAEKHCETVLAAANETFAAPSKDTFTKVGLPFVQSVAMPVTQAVIGGLAAFLVVFLLVRIPHLAFFTGVLVGGAAYYLSRNRIRKKAEDLLQHLPRHLYEMLATEWNSNIRRYAETVNAGLRS